MRRIGFEPEYAAERDKFFNYALWPYTPAQSLENRLKPSNLLYESFDAAGVDRRFFDLIPLLRQALGEFHTVFGVKQQGDRTLVGVLLLRLSPAGAGKVSIPRA